MNGDEKPQVVEYSRLPSPPQAPRSKKPLMIRLGWLFILGPMLVGLFSGLLHTLSNLISPGSSYQFGDMTITPVVAHGRGLEWLRLVVAIGFIILFTTMLWLGLRSARKYED